MGPTNYDEGFFVSADFKCFRKGVWGWGGGPLMMVKDSLFQLIPNVLGMGCGAREGGPIMTMKESLFLLVSNFWEEGVGLGGAH